MELARTKIDLTSKKQVDAYNKQLESVREQMRTFNRDVDDFNQSILDVNRFNAEFNVNCVNRPYRVADLTVLTEKERLLMEKGAQPFDLPVYSEEPTPPGEIWIGPSR